jgi:hypothetical protein
VDFFDKHRGPDSIITPAAIAEQQDEVKAQSDVDADEKGETEELQGRSMTTLELHNMRMQILPQL